jgi:UDP:flavonoid glycosyltransferase YjiC (YdhE family)
MGHATRCVPVIRQLLAQNHKVVIAADGSPLQFLKGYFPDLEFIRFPGARIIYPSGNNMVMKMMLQSPSILFNIYRENQHLKKIIKETGADVVISDNRFGLWSRQAYSVYITHQVMIKAPGKLKWTEPLFFRLHRWFINQYDECWIPDLPGENKLSGDLGHKYPVPGNASFVGLLSRFEQPDESQSAVITDNSPDLLFMLSGPEPQRTILEDRIMKETEAYPDLKVVILQGLPGEFRKQSPSPGITIFNHLPDHEMSRLICGAGAIICRPGYSTLMDLATLGRNALLIPTPGQTEQEYLAERLAASGSFRTISQDDFNLTRALAEVKLMPASFKINNNKSLLEDKIKSLATKIFAASHAG